MPGWLREMAKKARDEGKNDLAKWFNLRADILDIINEAQTQAQDSMIEDLRQKLAEQERDALAAKLKKVRARLGAIHGCRFSQSDLRLWAEQSRNKRNLGAATKFELAADLLDIIGKTEAKRGVQAG